ncbi:zinc c2h2 type family protein, putative [Ichthyophthirius multifiliis]|uniref:Zinc c2h2 type family protein, putative n=1 Tax=Ichthyophthirius multifiliis TaxID=5932 RepID=G0R0H3_ICHMU|nr:zinc c2h2 type family protein, putative [Ichthyophthirius multifiliis]EGR29024.1 zinc c2h2 type family protein, putative [Ichthyophthirius multifiliis]|eukprot:XP_004030260.1 zinc c2h2 type family protein, putative [Ichthyophthirius multifiliis]
MTSNQQQNLQIVSSSNNFYCTQCLISFQNDKEYKTHYKSEFHQYNIKRRLLDLIPATLEQFDQKKKQIHEQTIQKTNDKNKQKEDLFCNSCRKSFSNENSYKAHLQSNKHKENSKNNESPEKQIQKSPKKQALNTLQDQKICLFCDKKNEDIEKQKKQKNMYTLFIKINRNLEHMSKTHGFFICEQKYCIDVTGLLKHLGEKINKAFLCILCENKSCKDFQSGESVKKHMTDKGHCFMQSEVFEEYENYYDFTEQIQETIKYQESLFKNTAQSTKTIEYENEKKEKKKIRIQKIKQKKIKKKYQLYNYMKRIHKAIVNEIGELELPNGKILGHRSLRYIYKQYYRPIYNCKTKLKSIFGENQQSLTKFMNYISQSVIKKQIYSIHIFIIYFINLFLSININNYLFNSKDNKKKQSQTSCLTRQVLFFYFYFYDFIFSLGIKANSLQTYFRYQNPK